MIMYGNVSIFVIDIITKIQQKKKEEKIKFYYLNSEKFLN